MLKAVLLAGVGFPCVLGNGQAPLYVEPFQAYSGYSGDLSKVNGTVQVGQDGTDTQVLFFDLANVDARCDNATNVTGVANACGIHIHSGTSCASAAGHYWSSNFNANDPWATIRYTVPSSDANTTVGENVRVATGLALSNMAGRAVVVHDVTGARIACALLKGGAFTSGKQLAVSSFAKYPGYQGSLTVAGSMEIDLIGTGAEASQVLTFNLTGVAPTCGTANIAGVANACGIHVHRGKDCADAETIGGHYYDQAKITSDPWKPIMYAAKDGAASGVTIKVVTGVTSQDVAGRTMVVHDASGDRIACGAIPGDNTSAMIDSARSVTFAAAPLVAAFVMALLR